MKSQSPNLVWIGLGVGVFYWLTESLLHAYVFDNLPLSVTLAGEDDPNELWMRLLISVLFVAFGWIANRSVTAERHRKDDAQRLNRLVRFLDRYKQSLQHPAAAPALPGTLPADGNGGPAGVDDLAHDDDDIGRLTRFLTELSQFVDVRFKELYALLQLTRDINMGLLLDEVLEKAYAMLQPILPYDRLSVALIDDDGLVVRARWAKSNQPEILLPRGYRGWLRNSSLKDIISTGAPRIINDLPAYLKAHPGSDATRLMVAEGIRSSLTCPLISMGKPIGFMFFSSRSVDTYKHVHVEIFKLIAGHLSIVVEKSDLYQRVLLEKEKSERLLLNIMPARIAARLGAGEKPVAENLPEVDILFADIVEFTEFAGRYPPEHVLDLLQNLFVPLDRLCKVYGVEKVKTIGDEYMAMSSSLTSADDTHLRNLAQFALEALRLMEGMRYPDARPVRIRMGMHTGTAVAGVIGQEKFAYDIWGDAVNVASRMQILSEAGRILVTQDVYTRLRQEFRFEQRGVIEVKGKGPMMTYFLTAKK